MALAVIVYELMYTVCACIVGLLEAKNSIAACEVYVYTVADS